MEIKGDKDYVIITMTNLLRAINAKQELYLLSGEGGEEVPNEETG